MASIDSLPPRAPGDSWFRGNIEPRLSDLLRDPIIRSLMARDGVQMPDLLSIIGEAQNSLKSRP